MSQVQVGIGTSANDGLGDPIRTAFTKVNQNATDAELRLSTNETDISIIFSATTYINSLADLSAFLVSTTYELPPGYYQFNANIDFGTADIKLMDLNGCYFFRGACVSVTLTYTGITPFVTDDADGIILQWENMFVDTPNSAAFQLDNVGNSLIIELVVFLNTGAQSVIDGYAFLTTKYLISIASVTGFLANDVGTISCQVPQYNSGQNIAGIYLTVSGALSGSLTMSDIDSRPESNEGFLNITTNYGGLVSLTGGIHRSGGGVFLGLSDRDQSDPDINANNITNVPNSVNLAAGFLEGNSTATVVGTVDTPVKINATWTDVVKSRFNFNANGTWTYTGNELIIVAASLLCTINAAGGGTKTMSVYIAKNGSIVATAKGRGSGSSEAQISTIGFIPLSTGDTIEGFIENNSDGGNLTVTTASMDIRG